MDFAKKCPAKWAKETKPSSLNLSLYGYAAMAELESLLSCNGDPTISHAEIIARVRHVKNVYKVCCVNSDAKDFSSYGWVLARDYASKVENKVEQGIIHWQSMTVGCRQQTWC